MLHSETGIEEEHRFEDRTSIYLMDGTAVISPTSKVTKHATYVRVKDATGETYYPWFNIVRLRRESVSP